MHIIYCAQVCLCSHVVIDRLFSHSQYPSSLLAPNSAPQSHLHIGLPFGTPILCLQLEQVLIRLGSFSPLCVSFLSRSRSIKKRPSCFLFEIVLLFTFFFCRSIFFLFHCVTLHPHHISISDVIRNSISCLQAPQVRVCGGFIFLIPACDFFRKFVPSCGDTIRVLSICDSPFSFLLSFPFAPFLPFFKVTALSSPGMPTCDDGAFDVMPSVFDILHAFYSSIYQRLSKLTLIVHDRLECMTAFPLRLLVSNITLPCFEKAPFS